MSDFEKQFENFVGQIKFDDMPNPAHRDRLEKDLLEALACEKTPRPSTIWRIIMRSQITKLAAAAVIIVAVVLGLNIFNGTNAWAEIIKAIENVSNVHVINQIVRNNKEFTTELWIRRYDCIREENPYQSIIDNGRIRLYINKQKKEAQVSDSFLKDVPVSNHEIFEAIGIFSKNEYKDWKITKIDKESNENTITFAIETESNELQRGYKGKALVDAKSLLPIKIEGSSEDLSEPNNTRHEAFNFYYDPIPDEVFAIDIPEGYTELPRKESGHITGKVISEDGYPVEGALIVIGDTGRYLSEENLTDKNGNFTIKLSPLERKNPRFPFIVRAYKKDNPRTIAWTIIKRPYDKTVYDFEIPGKVGTVKGEYFCGGVSNVILQMEPAGVIFGQVTDKNSLPVDNAKVEIRYDLYDKLGNYLHDLGTVNLGGIGNSYTAEATTDKDGKYEITNIPRFSNKTGFTVFAYKEGFSKGKEEFQVSGGLDKHQVNLILYPAELTIRGVVKDNYGTYLDERYIRVSANGQEFESCRMKTDANGTFKIEGCPSIDGLEITANLNHNSYPPHFPKKFKSFTYYPPVTAKIYLEPGKKEYEVELLAEKPEIVLDVSVLNAAGDILPFFPVEIWAPNISPQWQWESDKQFIKLTDENGKCNFTEVPNIKGLRICTGASKIIFIKSINEDKKKIYEEYLKKYVWYDTPVEIIEGQKEYKIQVTAFTREDLQKKKESSK